jgi:hypothetical protein
LYPKEFVMNLASQTVMAASIGLVSVGAQVSAQSTYPFVANASGSANAEQAMNFASRIDARLRDVAGVRRAALPAVTPIDLFGAQFVITTVSARTHDGTSRDLSYVWIKQSGRWSVVTSNEPRRLIESSPVVRLIGG